MRHSPSEPALNMRSHSTSRSSSLTRNANSNANRPDLTTVPSSFTPMMMPSMKSKIYSPYTPSPSQNNHHMDYVPTMIDRPAGLDMDDFLPVMFSANF